MRFQKFNVLSNRALDPLGFQIGVLMVFGLELRPLPRNGQHVRGGSEYAASKARLVNFVRAKSATGQFRQNLAVRAISGLPPLVA
jgi:hypothetical protein